MNILDLLSHHDAVINLRMKCVIISVYNIVYFAVPGQVEDLSLEPGSHNITVNWNKPIEDSYCVTHYVIYWENTPSASNDTKMVPSDVNTHVIEHLDACVEYEVSVRAVNEKNESSYAVTDKTTTQTVGNYHAQIIYYIYDMGAQK